MHSPFSPSQLSRILACPGSVSLCLGIEEQKQSSYAAEGTLLHYATERAITEELSKVPADIVSPNLSREQRNVVEVCLEYLQALNLKLGLTNKVYQSIETQVTLDSFGEPDVYGTADVILATSNSIHVIDWKFGRGVEVHASHNLQLRAYALGALGILQTLENMKTSVSGAKIKEIHCHVVQPRLHNFDEEVLSAEDLLRWFKHELQPGLDRARSKNPSFSAGVIQCRWCDAKLECPTRRREAQVYAKKVFAAYTQLPDVAREEMADLLSQSKLLTQYLKDLELWAFIELQAGRKVPGFKLVPGRSKRAWIDETKVIEYLESVAIEPYDFKLKSPPKIEKELSITQKRTNEFQELIEKTKGRPLIAPITDHRQPLASNAETAFKSVIE